MKSLLISVGLVAILGILAAAILSVVRPSSFGPQMPYNNDIIVINFSKSMCLGTCPAYELTITARTGHDGSLKFVPNAFTCETMWKRRVLAHADIERLVRQFDKAEFFMSPHLREQPLPEDVAKYRIDASIGGQRAAADGVFWLVTEPDAVDELANMFVEIADTEGWVTGCSEKERVEQWS